MSKIIGRGAPTKDTPAILGQEYLDKDTGIQYKCTKVNVKPGAISGDAVGEYIWEPDGGASSWNDLADKPFGEEGREPIILDSNAADKTNLPFGEMYKLTDNPPQWEEMIGATLTHRIKFSSDRTTTRVVDEDLLVDGSEQFGCAERTVFLDNNGGFFIVFSTDITMEGTGIEELDGITIEKGFYALELFKSLVFPQTIKPLDEKFLPESVEGVVIRSSTADSTKKFKLTVDDSGTISATEVT